MQSPMALLIWLMARASTHPSSTVLALVLPRSSHQGTPFLIFPNFGIFWGLAPDPCFGSHRRVPALLLMARSAIQEIRG